MSLGPEYADRPTSSLDLVWVRYSTAPWILSACQYAPESLFHSKARSANPAEWLLTQLRPSRDRVRIRLVGKT